jgi:hypothetical protein
MIQDMESDMLKDPANLEEIEQIQQAKLREAWPHLRSAVKRRAMQGAAVEDLAGVVTESQADDGNVTIGVLTRAELLSAIAESGGEQHGLWIERLRQPAPEGCIYVFGALGGLPNLYAMGPVFPRELVN